MTFHMEAFVAKMKKSKVEIFREKREDAAADLRRIANHIENTEGRSSSEHVDELRSIARWLQGKSNA